VLAGSDDLGDVRDVGDDAAIRGIDRAARG
jgi:hypothetical protein